MGKFLAWVIVVVGAVAIFSGSSKNNNGEVTPSSSFTNSTQSSPQSDTPKVQAESTVDNSVSSSADSSDSSSDCNANYEPCVPDSPYDLDCADIGFEVTVTGTDVYRLDRDHDGYGCESY